MRNKGNIGYWLPNAGIPLWQREKSVTKAGYFWLPVVTREATHRNSLVINIGERRESTHQVALSSCEPQPT